VLRYELLGFLEKTFFDGIVRSFGTGLDTTSDLRVLNVVLKLVFEYFGDVRMVG